MGQNHFPLSSMLKVSLQLSELGPISFIKNLRNVFQTSCDFLIGQMRSALGPRERRRCSTSTTSLVTEGQVDLAPWEGEEEEGEVLQTSLKVCEPIRAVMHVLFNIRARTRHHVTFIASLGCMCRAFISLSYSELLLESIVLCVHPILVVVSLVVVRRDVLFACCFEATNGIVAVKRDLTQISSTSNGNVTLLLKCMTD